MTETGKRLIAAAKEMRTMTTLDNAGVEVAHADDAAVDSFAAAMKAKLKWERDERGRGGWQGMSADDLSRLLYEHLPKGDPVDIANFAMMLHQNGQRIISYLAALPAEPSEVVVRRQRDEWPDRQAEAEPVPANVAEMVTTLRNKRMRVHDLSGVGWVDDPDCIAAASLLTRVAAERNALMSERINLISTKREQLSGLISRATSAEAALAEERSNMQELHSALAEAKDEIEATRMFLAGHPTFSLGDFAELDALIERDRRAILEEQKL